MEDARTLQSTDDASARDDLDSMRSALATCDTFKVLSRRMREENDRYEAMKNISAVFEESVNALKMQMFSLSDDYGRHGTTSAHVWEGVVEESRNCAKTLLQVADSADFSRYRHLFRNPLQECIHALLLGRFLVFDELLPLDDATDALGMQIDLEDYLMGVISLCSTITRLAVRCVINEHYEKVPILTSAVFDIWKGFLLFNLKNDVLRRRFDAMKYETKRCEDLLLDLRIRRLLPGKGPSSTNAASDGPRTDDFGEG